MKLTDAAAARITELTQRADSEIVGLRVGITERLAASALVAQPLWYGPELAVFGVEQQTRYRFTIALRL